MSREEATHTGDPDPSTAPAADGYAHERVESRWQDAWDEARVFDAPVDPDPATAAYVLGMFPYTSGELHMGHVRNYAITDAFARFRRMQGATVLHPMGWDAFGLPAENAALEAREADPDADVTPESYTRECIRTMREDFQSLGLGYDWRREFATCDPEYYRWNQWLFTEFREAGLVDRQDRAVNWCPDCETVLADEQVETDTADEHVETDTGEAGSGEVEVCWRCDTEIVERDLEQWFFRITEYADELLADLDALSDWPASVIDQQRNWIGRTEGAEVDFTLHVPDEDRGSGGGHGDGGEDDDEASDASDGGEHDDDSEAGDAGDDEPKRAHRRDEDVTVFTTRLDTIFGATFVALAPDHPIAVEVAERDPAVREFVDEVADPEGDEPRGVLTDVTATNPATGEEISVFVADFVLSDVGTGALMAVPAHDERDHAFASRHDVQIRQVVAPAGAGDGDAGDAGDGDASDAGDVDVESAAFTDDGVLVGAGEYDGLSSAEARAALVEDLPSAESAVQYRLRDWGISRQRYWGTPIPIVHCPDCGAVSVPDDDLPVELPEFVPATGNPLEAATDWRETTCPDCGGPAERETDTMDTFVGSSWYYARFAGGPEVAPPDPDGEDDGDLPFDPAVADAWLPVDEYVGGDEHAVMHLLYARFVTKALRDRGYLAIDEPFDGLTTQGMVLGEDGAKMSKSRGNGVSPARIVREYGADTARTFTLGAAEPERDVAWNPEGVERQRRFLDRVHDLAAAVGPTGDSPGSVQSAENDASPAAAYVAREVDATIDAVTDHYAAMRFDHVLRDVRDLVDTLSTYREHEDPAASVVERGVGVVVRLLAPIAPHVCETAWEALGSPVASRDGSGLVATAPWPTPVRDLEGYDAESRLVSSTREDVRDIVDTAEIEDPARIELVVAPEWTYDALALARDAVGTDSHDESAAGTDSHDQSAVGTDSHDQSGEGGGVSQGELTSAVMADPAMRERGEAAAAYAAELAEGGVLPPNLGAARERIVLERAAWLFEREFDAPVAVHAAEADAVPERLADRARPGRPAIHVHQS